MGSPRVTPPPDHVSRLVAGWRAERPDLEVEPLEVVYRVSRLAAHFNAEIDRTFQGTGLTTADFAVLANLRRAGEPFQLSQRRLMEALGLTSGTVSVRVDRLERGGLVDRHPDPHDARGVLVTLTSQGSRIFDEVAPRHLANEERLVSALGAGERAELAHLLHVLLVEFEPLSPEPGSAYGFTVYPAHAGIERRRELGLGAPEGLVVATVTPGGPASAAGLRPGDVLIRAGRRLLRSLSCLTEATSGSGPLPLTYLRESVEIRVTVPAPQRFRQP